MFDELDVLIAMLKTDATLGNTWFFDGSKIIFYNNHRQIVGMAFYEKGRVGYEEGLIDVIGPIFPLGYLTAADVYTHWANYVMTED